MDAGQSGKAEDAVVVDSTDLSLAEVIDVIVRLAEQVPSPRYPDPEKS
jgi:cytidylate kinase